VPKPGCSFLCLFCVVVYFVTNACLLLLCSIRVFQYLANRLDAKHVSKITYLGRVELKTLTINQVEKLIYRLLHCYKVITSEMIIHVG